MRSRTSRRRGRERPAPSRLKTGGSRASRNEHERHMEPNLVLLYLFVVGPLLALVVSVVGSVPVILDVGERWLIVLIAVPVVMIGSQVIELQVALQTGVVPGTPGGEFVETVVNVLTAGAVYYGLSVTRDRQSLAETLAAQQRRHERLVAEALSPILVVSDGEIVEANPEANRYFGATETGLDGSKIRRLIADDAWPAFENRLQRVAETGTPEQITELGCRTRDGEERLAAVVLGPAEFAGSDAVRLTLRDLTEHREMSAELDRVRDRLEETFNNTNDAILVTDTACEEILECNQTACELFGADRETLLETAPSAVYDRAALSSFLDRVRAEDGEATAELVCETATGETVPTEVSASLTTLGDREVLLAIVRDVRDRRRRERRIRVMSRLLRHNLRNDMTVVLGHLDRLRAAAPDAAADHADRIETVVEDLLDLSGEVQIAQDTLDDPTVTVLHAETLLENAVDACLSSTDRDPQVTVDARADLRVRTDQLLEVALRHLVDNAVEHADHERPTVTAAARRDGDAVRFTVADDGPGIPDVDRRVVTGDTEITDAEHVDGFGLWVVAWVTDTLDGSVEFRDNEPCGTVVEIRVPDAVVEEGDSVDPSPATATGGGS